MFSKFENGKQIRWDASSLEKAAACKRLYKLVYLDDRKRQAIEGGARGWGSAMHAGLDAYEVAKFFGDRDPVLAGIEAIVKTGFVGAEDSQRTLGTAVRTLIWYDEFFKDEELKTMTLPGGQPAIEVRFELPLPGTPYRFSGRMDRVIELGDQLYIMEHKTTKTTLSNYFFNRYHPSFQVGAYCWAARELFGKPAGAVILNGIQTAVGFARFARTEFRLTDSQVDEWLDAARAVIKDIDRAHETGAWPPNFTSCNNYGGCDYRFACSVAPEFRESILQSDFPEGNPDA